METVMDQLLPSRDAAAYLGITPGTLENWRNKGFGPAFLKTSPSRRGKVLYRVCDIAEWQQANLYTSTADVGAKA
jgi:hypothetical protein